MNAKQLDTLEQSIALAQDHIRNAKAWIKAARTGRDTGEYHVSECLTEAASILEAAARV